MSNHLQNVLVTISDKKLAVDSDGNGTVDYYNADVVTANDYYPFGMTMPGRKFETPNSTYRYGFNGQEKSKEINENSTTAEFWQYDARLGRRWNVDPLASKFPHMSPYAAFNNNPLRFTDPTGMAPESIHIDSKGNVLLNKDDGDNTVYMHGSKVTTKDVEKAYTSSDHSAGGFKVGELGGNIKSGIIKNILKENKGTASSLPKAFAEDEWVARVAPKQEWDYKNNKSTIFGVAWAFDEDNKAKTGSQTKTSFTDDVLPGNPTWASAADFGNFNAGYTGIYATIPILRQYKWAGAGELLKGHPDAAKRFNQWYGNIAPYGDNQRDYDFNTFGMKAAFMEMSKGFFKF